MKKGIIGALLCSLLLPCLSGIGTFAACEQTAESTYNITTFEGVTSPDDPCKNDIEKAEGDSGNTEQKGYPMEHRHPRPPIPEDGELPPPPKVPPHFWRGGRKPNRAQHPSESEPEKRLPTSDNTEQDSESVSALSDDVEVGSRILELLFGKKKEQSNGKLWVLGTVFGIRLKQNGVTIAAVDGIPALSAGDKLLSVNGQRVTTGEEVKALIAKSGGESVTLRVKHRGAEINIEIKPKLVDGEYKLGLTLRDGAMGIGTMTYYNPDDGSFGGLGHGICDPDSGEIVEMSSGEVTGALLGGINKGEAGKPGELYGIVTEDVNGTLCKNNGCGVFGKLTSAPEGARLVEVGSKSEIHEGEATIITTLKNGKAGEYKIKIHDIDRSSTGSKSFRITVTDEVLLALTGGIVRGMSGSPIIQDGKLVGAVTHVMVADPTEGYGIFIENMLSAASAGALPKAA